MKIKGRRLDELAEMKNFVGNCRTTGLLVENEKKRLKTGKVVREGTDQSEGLRKSGQKAKKNV